MSAVLMFSLIVRELCPLHPFTLIMPLSWSMSFRCTVASSCASNPCSFRIVKIVEYFCEEAEMILSMFWVVGIMGILRSHLK